MIKALPEMLNCLNTMVNQSGNSTDMSILERQRAHQHFQSMINNDSGLGELVNRVMKMDPGLENDWSESGEFGGVDGSGFGFGLGSSVFGNGSGFEMNYAIARTASCPPAVAACDSTRRESTSPEKLSYAIGRECFKKRKADMSHNIKVVAKEENKDKRLKGLAEEEESKITEENSNGDKKTNKRNNNNNRETSADTSKDNSKVSEVRKPDYIHVRARRGQATDSHSLAERVRREKISERMKYLQDLVPGCNKITGKAGMLDEIINYVQSLQRQVEFLSMKLAAVNPRLDFTIDNFFAKEAFPACTSNFPTIGVSQEMANQRYLQLNPLQLVSCTTPDTAVQRSIGAPISIPETFLDSSYFNAIQPSTWDTDLQNLYSMEFPQGRSASFPSQQLIGSMEAGSLKMEM